MSDAFWTGFANSLTSGIEERRKTANDYFERQLEIAQTTGLENYKNAKAKADESLRYARQLEQMGVPKHVIMEQASANPEGLSSFYDAALKIQTESNRPVVAEDWENLYTVANSMKGNEQDFATFFNQMYGPATQAMNNDPEGFKRDPRGSIWAAMFAANPYGDARRRLDNTEIIDGMSATDLLSQGDSTFTGDNVVTPNVDVMSDLIGEEEELSPQVRSSIGKDVGERLANKVGGIQIIATENPEAYKEELLRIRNEIISELESIYIGRGEISYITSVIDDLINRELERNKIPIEPQEDSVIPKEGEIIEESLDNPSEPNAEEPPPPTTTLPNEDEIRQNLSDAALVDEMGNPLIMNGDQVFDLNGDVVKDLNEIKVRSENGTATLQYVGTNEDGTVTYLDVATGQEYTDTPGAWYGLSKQYN